MKKKKNREEDGVIDGFAKDLQRSPEWAAHGPGRASLTLYIILIIAAVCLCTGTLAVLLR